MTLRQLRQHAVLWQACECMMDQPADELTSFVGEADGTKDIGGVEDRLSFVAAETHDLGLEELASLQRIGDAAKSVQSVFAFGEDTRVTASLQLIAAEAKSVQWILLEHIGGSGLTAGIAAVAGGAAEQLAAAAGSAFVASGLYASTRTPGGAAEQLAAAAGFASVASGNHASTRAPGGAAKQRAAAAGDASVASWESRQHTDARRGS